MFSTSFRRIAAFLTVYLLVGVIAAPLENFNQTLSYEKRDLASRATPAAPHFAVYADSYQPGVTGPPAVSAIRVSNGVSCPFCSEVLIRTAQGFNAL